MGVWSHREEADQCFLFQLNALSLPAASSSFNPPRCYTSAASGALRGRRSRNAHFLQHEMKNNHKFKTPAALALKLSENWCSI